MNTWCEESRFSRIALAIPISAFIFFSVLRTLNFSERISYRKFFTELFPQLPVIAITLRSFIPAILFRAFSILLLTNKYPIGFAARIRKETSKGDSMSPTTRRAGKIKAESQIRLSSQLNARTKNNISAKKERMMTNRIFLVKDGFITLLTKNLASSAIYSRDMRIAEGRGKTKKR